MTKQPDKHDALYLAGVAKRERTVLAYRCGIKRHGEMVARLHPTEYGLLLVAHGRILQQLDPTDDTASNPFVIAGWRNLTDGQRRDAVRQRAEELVMARDVRDPQWAVHSYARLIRSQSRTAAVGLDRRAVYDAAWFTAVDDAVAVSCSRHTPSTLTVAEARRLYDEHNATCAKALCSSCSVLL